MLHKALEGAIILETFPKTTVDVFALVLESSGSKHTYNFILIFYLICHDIVFDGLKLIEKIVLNINLLKNTRKGSLSLFVFSSTLLSFNDCFVSSYVYSIVP